MLFYSLAGLVRKILILPLKIKLISLHRCVISFTLKNYLMPEDFFSCQCGAGQVSMGNFFVFLN